jgi:Cdc6-like AAA superfamily ATPase
MEYHEIIANLNPCPLYIITTNYDRLLEKAITETNYVPISCDEQVGQMSQTICNLFKIHGDMDRLNEAVITKKDIENYPNKYDALWAQITSLLQSRPVLFLGYGLQESHIRDTYLKIHELLKNHTREIYFVSPYDVDLSALKDLKIITIKKTAGKFLKELSDQMSKIAYSTMPFEVRDVPDVNPFSIYSTEFFDENHGFLPDGDLLNNVFIEPIHFAQVASIGNTIIEGHRGSGKSMILRYLSYDTQIKRKFSAPWDRNNIGIYVKLKTGISINAKPNQYRGDPKGWGEFFLSYANLLIGECILANLNRASKIEPMTPECEKYIVSDLHYLFFEDDDDNLTLDRLIMRIQKERNQLVRRHDMGMILPYDFLEQMTSVIKKHYSSWSNKNLYFLLDEYDSLCKEQQKVVNTLLRSRSFSYKIAVRLKGMTFEDVNGDPLQPLHDYTLINTDRFDNEVFHHAKIAYKQFAIDVANKRLEAYGYKNKIEELLLTQQSPSRRGYKNNDYSGLDNIIKLSGYIIRDYMEMCKDIIYYSNPEIITGPKKQKLIPADPTVQNAVIRIHSNLLYETISQIPGVDQDTGRSKSQNVRELVDSMAILYRTIFQATDGKRTVSAFDLKNQGSLSVSAKEALDNAIMNRQYQQPMSDREPKNPDKDSLLARYKMTRLLCPRYKLGLGDKSPSEIDAKYINEIVAGKGQETIDYIRDYYLKQLRGQKNQKLDHFGVDFGSELNDDLDDEDYGGLDQGGNDNEADSRVK